MVGLDVCGRLGCLCVFGWEYLGFFWCWWFCWLIGEWWVWVGLILMVNLWYCGFVFWMESVRVNVWFICLWFLIFVCGVCVFIIWCFYFGGILKLYFSFCVYWYVCCCYRSGIEVGLWIRMYWWMFGGGVLGFWIKLY